MEETATTREAGGAHRWALITGASSGIGAAFAERLARDDYDLVVVARRTGLLDKLAADLRTRQGIEVEVLSADLTEPEALRRIEERVAGDPPLELLVNNAGFGTLGHFAELDPDREVREILLNAVAPMRLMRAALPGMIARGRGVIVNVSSLAALVPGPYNATYGATKAFLNSFTEAVHEELRGTGVRLQALCPGPVRTGFQEKAGADPDRFPSFTWMSPEAVVEASLESLRKGELICVPGVAGRATARLTGVFPRSLARRVYGNLMRRTLD